MTTHTCKNCGNQFTGAYCNKCGEKVHHEHDKSFVHLFEEVFHFATHLDGTLITTVKTFLTKPGKFSFDFCAGVRKKYLRPITFFLTIVIIYLLFPRFQGLNMRYYAYVSKDYNYSWYAAPVAKKKIHTLHITEPQLAERYDHKSPGFSKLFLLVLIPLSAVILMLIFFSSRRFFFDHFILATELCSFYIFSHFLFLPFISLVVDKIIPSWSYMFWDGSWIWLVMMAIYGSFIVISFRNFYKQKWWIVILKGLLFLFVFVWLIRYVYSLLLYYLVMLFI